MEIENLEKIARAAELLSIWRPATVEQQPHVKLTRWRVFQVSANLEHKGDSIHFVGDAGYEGRVSSPIVEYDEKTQRGVSRSGRVYELDGPTGSSSDALYVWGVWLDRVGNAPSIDVSHLYDKYTD